MYIFLIHMQIFSKDARAERRRKLKVHSLISHLDYKCLPIGAAAWFATGRYAAWLL